MRTFICETLKWSVRDHLPNSLKRWRRQWLPNRGAGPLAGAGEADFNSNKCIYLFEIALIYNCISSICWRQLLSKMKKILELLFALGEITRTVHNIVSFFLDTLHSSSKSYVRCITLPNSPKGGLFSLVCPQRQLRSVWTAAVHICLSLITCFSFPPDLGMILLITIFLFFFFFVIQFFRRTPLGCIVVQVCQQILRGHFWQRLVPSFTRPWVTARGVWSLL